MHYTFLIPPSVKSLGPLNDGSLLGDCSVLIDFSELVGLVRGRLSEKCVIATVY